MALVELVMPKMGESVMEGTILSWLKSEGDSIEEDESILEVATDKVDTEIPSVYKGKLKEILAQEGDVVEVGKPIAIIEIDDASDSPSDHNDPAIDESPEHENEEAQLLEEAVTAHSSSSITSKKTTRFYSPLVKNIAKQENISIDELESVPGTGQDGRVTKNDMLAYLKSKKLPASSNGHQATKPQPVSIIASGEDEIIEMDRMRKMIAERMISSRQISAHVTSFVEADVTEIVKWRGKMKNIFMEREGQALTYTPIIIEAIVKAIRDYPMINIQVDGTRIIKKSAINIGLAVALPSGNLIVPVIKNADQLSILGLTQKINDFARRARENKLSADELSGGTFTVSNVGSFGNVMGTPIIMQPQVAILALGAIQKKPSVIETPQGDFIGIRSKMFLSHSYDHRVVDGALGGMFVRRVADYLEGFDINRNI
ncbi:MAG: 2-oxoglutarate dehydrogenase E2 component (dihydrolipoamide succinyltransferase) [Cyclobacteriaceae bacterium]|jgi:2-oxoglutarate dehydrogenase E2 component (dihydrolipoamide succinyltransferase)